MCAQHCAGLGLLGEDGVKGLQHLGAPAGSELFSADKPPDQLSLVHLGVSSDLAYPHVPHEVLERFVLHGLEGGALDFLPVDPLLPAALDEELSASGGDGSSGEGVWDQDLRCRSQHRPLEPVARFVGCEVLSGEPG